MAATVDHSREPSLIKLLWPPCSALNNQIVLFRYRYIGEGCQFDINRQEPTRQGTNTNRQYPSQGPTASFYSTKLKMVDRAQRPKITSIAQARKRSPPIQLRQTNELTKNPLLKKPIERSPNPFKKPSKEQRPKQSKAEAATPKVLVLKEKQIGQKICPAPEAIRKRRERAECSIAILLLRTAKARTVKAIMSRRYRWKWLLFPTNSMAISMESQVEMSEGSGCMMGGVLGIMQGLVY